MRKFLLLIAAVALMGGVAFADATFTTTINGRNMSTDKGVNQGVAVVDASSGYTQNVDSRGAALVKQVSSVISASTGATLNAGYALYSGASRISSVTCSGFGTSAGDYVLIYDDASATGTPVIECTVGTAKDTNSIVIPGGADLTTGIFADSNSNAVHVSVSYDY